MPKYTEIDIQNAKKDVAAGYSIRRAAQANGVPFSTLHGRLRGALPSIEAQEDVMKLSLSVERRLADWIRIQAALGLPPSHATVREFALRILQRGFDPNNPPTLGKRWVTHFLHRHPSIATKQGKIIDSVRVSGASEDRIALFFERLRVPEVTCILGRNRYNMDETGLMEGKGANGIVIGRSEVRQELVKDIGNRSWISIVECIGTDGTNLSPLVIYTGAKVQAQWFHDAFSPSDYKEISKWKFDSTKTGYSNCEIALWWLKDVFIPQTAPKDPSEWRLLFLDGHESHVSDDFMWECYNSKIWLIYPPSHATHVLQPLDVGVFSVLKSKYRAKLSQVRFNSTSSPIAKQVFLLCYKRAREDAFSAKNITSAWRTTGLWPVSMTSAMRSRFVFKTTPKKDEKNPKEISPASLMAKKTPSAIFKTPQNRRQLQLGVDALRFRHALTPSTRYLFRKAANGLDVMQYELAQKERQIERLEAQLEALRPKKRKKVEPDPNGKFVTITDIMAAKAALPQQKRQKKAAGEILEEETNLVIPKSNIDTELVVVEDEEKEDN
jgi:hypothetical protein